jgi:hypothetical protein
LHWPDVLPLRNEKANIRLSLKRQTTPTSFPAIRTKFGTK